MIEKEHIEPIKSTGKNKSDDEKFIQAVKTLDLKYPITRQPVIPKQLIEVLKDDVVYAVTRPGSWEGANMLTVLHGHGFIEYW